MQLSDFHFDLPPELIATTPAEPRDHARLLVVHRETQTIEHARFDDLPKWISRDDLLILNNSKVLPARLSAENGSVEILLLEETSPQHWLAIGDRKLKPGRKFKLDPHSPQTSPVEMEVLGTLPSGERVIRFLSEINLDDFGSMPLPPYIEKMRKQTGMPLSVPEDRDWYQTTFSEKGGSVAAPTAGLHFTPELLQKFNHAFVTLHVGLGTFRPVKVENIEDHDMHSERYSIPQGLQEKAAKAKRVIAVGTTASRVIETIPDLHPCSGQTKIFIYPPYKFKRVDAMVTNFHLPGSTLIMLVASFMELELQKRAYAEAIAQKYRFYSYGDAMLIL